MPGQLSRFCADESGNVAVFVGISLPVFLGLAALTIDGAMLRHTAHRMQIAADAGALAAALQLPDHAVAQAAAMDVARRNYGDVNDVSIVEGAGIAFGNWNGTSFAAGGSPENAVRVRTGRTGARDNRFNAIFGGIVGFDGADLERDAVAELILGPPCASFEGFPAGTVITDQLPGMTVSVDGGADMAMVFDTDNPTGGDWDLATETQGKVLIISEDGDSSDPDDNARGGTITFTFDYPVHIESIIAVDVEEGAQVTALDNFGNIIATSATPRQRDGEISTVNFDIEDVYVLEFEMKGSGAFDDLCFGTRSRAVRLVE